MSTITTRATAIGRADMDETRTGRVRISGIRISLREPALGKGLFAFAFGLADTTSPHQVQSRIRQRPHSAAQPDDRRDPHPGCRGRVAHHRTVRQSSPPGAGAASRNRAIDQASVALPTPRGPVIKPAMVQRLSVLKASRKFFARRRPARSAARSRADAARPRRGRGPGGSRHSWQARVITACAISAATASISRARHR